MGMGHVEQAIVIKELSRVSPSVGKCLDVYILGLEALDLYANHEQKTVSYTHLDVYKRQVMEPTRRPTRRPVPARRVSMVL